MGLFIILFPALILVAVLAGSIAIYLNDRERRGGKARSLPLYVGGILLAGALPGWLFIVAGAPGFCYMFPGEECGWAAGGIGLPALFGLGIATFLYFWKRRGNAP
jgi:hypothetical protein